MKLYPRPITILTIVLALALILNGCSLLKPGNGSGNKTAREPAQADLSPAELSSMEQRLQDLTARVEAIEPLTTRMTAQDAALSALENRLSTLEKKAIPTDKPVAQPSQPDTVSQVYTEPMVLYQDARNLLLDKRFKEAAALFKTYASTYPDSELADNALYWLGECHYSQGEFLKAVKLFKTLVKRYPKGSKVPDALLKTAYAYLALDDTNKAHSYLKNLVKTYPFTSAGEKAEAKLRSLQ